MVIIHKQNALADHPFDEICTEVDKHARNGALCFQKWTCGGCGKRLMAGAPNYFTAMGHCDECGHDTDIKTTGCNYALVRVVLRD